MHLKLQDVIVEGTGSDLPITTKKTRLKYYRLRVLFWGGNLYQVVK